ncbi:DUF771 domain-containing protein [Pediococcus acidilactici]|uniref:DUF771 domain-containing protein n=1 Tax=Pediococcus acidilactici TaxID=1254 RepID=A0AAW8YML3_PEDAC|nr:DUF771 domain-containing protein [Pediococcus acidilactici]MDV2911058.1 DUF771 domain-containing protein [Pediococcus acidilactici]WQS17618.1 DUF771 domain-containing protein [Pediococcus acidilactici]
MAQVVEATIKFEIPEDKVLVDRIEWEKIQEKASKHEIWQIEDLKRYMLNRKIPWINHHILANPRLTRQLDELRERGALGGGGKGVSWWMFADEIKKFINDNKEVIMRED